MTPKEREGDRASIGKVADLEASGPLPIAPDGGIAFPGLAPEMPSLPWNAENCMCLRGPCRYYFEVAELAQVETRGLEFHPIEESRMCTAINGVALEIDENVLRCSRWDPIDRTEEERRENRRDDVLEEHPEYVKADEAREKLRREARRKIDEAAAAAKLEVDADQALPPPKEGV